MKFYVDECLSPHVADEISDRRGHRAVHAARDLGFSGRDDEFHVRESRKRGEILVTSNHHDFREGFGWFRDHPGIVVFKLGASANASDQIGATWAMFSLLRSYRISAKPPARGSLVGVRLYISPDRMYFDTSDGERFDLDVAEWEPATRTKSPALGR